MGVQFMSLCLRIAQGRTAFEFRSGAEESAFLPRDAAALTVGCP